AGLGLYLWRQHRPRRRVLAFERRSYMHRDVITHVVCTETDFIITAGHDGRGKFWEKIEEGIEFVKHFRIIESVAVSSEGALFCSAGDEKAMKEFEAVNFDMIHMLKLGYFPGQCEWIHCPGNAISSVAPSEKSTGKIFIYDVYKAVVASDKSGMIEYWTGPPLKYKFPKTVNWEYKTDSDSFEFAKCKAYPTSICFSPDGKKIATVGSDRKVRIFRFLYGKLMRVFDESLNMFTELQQMRQQLPDVEFGQRMAVEHELEKADAVRSISIVFDETGHFVLYGSMLGIKAINNRKPSTVSKKHRAATPTEMNASENLFFRIFKFYMSTKGEPEDRKSADSDGDVFNEKPSKEVMAATQAEGPKRVSDSAIIHTGMGGIHIKLFPAKTVENFCVHSRNGYYNGHAFHHIIKGFMIQTGDPTGIEDRPYTLSMANTGSNTNESQFFLTVAPTPWLANKHTVFGRVTKGMEVVQRISNGKVNPKTNKPYEDVSIINITVK
uniref:peptidylprolyl isomerase n=1 Tax=Cebus imitator TaxID=2715852 RepID=A0A2K5P9B1_CEBIM